MIARQTAASKDGLFSALRPCLRKTLSIFFPAFDVGGGFCCGKPGAKLDRIRSVNFVLVWQRFPPSSLMKNTRSTNPERVNLVTPPNSRGFHSFVSLISTFGRFSFHFHFRWRWVWFWFKRNYKLEPSNRWIEVILTKQVPADSFRSFFFLTQLTEEFLWLFIWNSKYSHTQVV